MEEQNDRNTTEKNETAGTGREEKMHMPVTGVPAHFNIRTCRKTDSVGKILRVEDSPLYREISLEEPDFSPHAYNFLHKAGILTLGALLDLPFCGLKAVPGIGVRNVQDIFDSLYAFFTERFPELITAENDDDADR